MSPAAPLPSHRPARRAAPTRTREWSARSWWLVPLAIATVEVLGQIVQLSRVVPGDDWSAAATFVESEWLEADALVSAPHWTDPLLRTALGERIELRDAGRSDLVGYRRLWVLSIRGHRAHESPDRPPEVAQDFGRVRVERWQLETNERVLFDFVDRIDDARVTMLENGAERECRFQSSGRPAGGGLGTGPTTPSHRHVCDPGRPWLWVGATVQEDLKMLPHRCVWQHPAGAEPIRARFEAVPLGDRIVLYASLWWEHERTMEGGPVDIALSVEGQQLATLSHRDGDGRARLDVELPPALRGRVGTVDLSVSSLTPNLRTLCWSATTRSEFARDAPHPELGQAAAHTEAPTSPVSAEVEASAPIGVTR